MDIALDDLRQIQSSPLFDEKWYIAQYPDVAALGYDPALHYLALGAALLRNPSEGFDTAFYLKTYPDVAEAGINPLLHFERYGNEEGRLPQSFVLSTSLLASRVDVVVPVYNALEDVQRCLQSIALHTDGYALRVVVVNDGSNDETTAWLRDYVSTNAQCFELVENSQNAGYTKAANSGLRRTSAPFVVLLNSDTIVTNGWLKGLIRCLESAARIGIAGPLSNAASWQNVPNLYDEAGQFAVNRLPNNMTADDMAATVRAVSARSYPRVPFVNGFCFAMKRELLAKLGQMDEINFPKGYGEENDFSLRAAAAGYELAIADDVYVFHAKSKSFGHDQRRILSAEGAHALERLHGKQHIDALVKQLKEHSGLNQVRMLVNRGIAQPVPALGSEDVISTRVLFLLPVKGGGGGAHSVVQEAAAMRRIGVHAHVAVNPQDLAHYRALYSDVAEVDTLFIGADEAGIVQVAMAYEVVVATIFGSVQTLRKILEKAPHICPCYYVQDYEPLFFVPGSPEWNAAKSSYALISDLTLFAKTTWIAERVRQEHGLYVHKVLPSIDHEVYKPRMAARDRSRIRIAAMVRPQTPRRGAERTMRVLSRIGAQFPDLVEVNIFGADETPQLRGAGSTSITNCGVLKRSEVAALLARSDIFVDLSDYQAFGRTALEAMACGCTAVVPVHGGSDEYAVDGLNSLVVNTSNEDECVTRLAALLGDLPKLRRMQVQGLQTAARYNVHAAAVSELVVLGSALARWRNRKTEAVVRTDAPQRRAVTAAGTSERKLPITALVITWDVGHNPIGRSYMLAEVVDRVVRNVVNIGFQFPRYGKDIWEPVRNGRLPVITLPGGDLPAMLDTIERVAKQVKADVVISCKPRLPSLQLGAAIKQRTGCPLILDIDDHELSFFPDGKEVTMGDLRAMPDGAAAAQIEPFGDLWTRLAQHLRKYADEIVVSNVALHDEFGGTIVPHVRDETVFDPALYDRDSMRQKYGVPVTAKIVLFFGTPRHHKGVGVLATAINAITDPSFKLLVVGNAPDKSVTAKLDSIAPGRILYLPNQPFAAIPEIMAMADIVCLPQDEGSAISKFQLPAKAIDAVAMGLPLLVTKTAPLMQLVRDGVAQSVETAELPALIESIAGSRSACATWAQRVRPQFLEHYSYAAAGRLMRNVIQKAIKNNDSSRTSDLAVLVEQQRRLTGAVERPDKKREPGVDIVVFWKQNDTGLYGRRSDMVVKYLASRKDVRRVIVVDTPISEHDLLSRRNKANGLTHDRLIYVRTYEKAIGKHDTDKVKYRVFIHPPGVYRNSEHETAKPLLSEGYFAYLKSVFEEEGVDARDAIFWLYPKNYLAKPLVEHFQPAQVVTDVVDDHRAWPGVSEQEKARLTENYRETLAFADMAFVNCAPMLESMSEFRDGVRLVPNGCDASPVLVQPRNNAAFEVFSAWKGKVIGFVGNLEQKIDIELIGKIAEQYRDCLVVLVGSTHANPVVLQLQKYSNVLMPGIVPYEEVGAWMSRFDVGIIPHLDMEMTRNMNPLKLYVYLSWRIPVVSTEIFNVDNSSEFVFSATTHAEFLKAVGHAMHQRTENDENLTQYINANSWESRMKQHVDELMGMSSQPRQ